jgi:small subunit ribosomal protein S24e
MNVTIVSKEEAPLLSRSEVKLDMTFSGPTPTRKVLITEAAKLLKSKEDQIVIHRIDQKFGFGKATAEVYLYHDKDFMKKVEREHMFQRTEPKKKGEQKPTGEK